MKLIKLQNVIEMTGLSRTGIYRLMAEKQFPEKVNLGARAVAWVESEVQDWIIEKIEQRDTKNALNSAS